jgi:hypothetical protein
MARNRKNIAAIEAWENYELEPRAGMKSLLDFLSVSSQIRYSYNFIYTPQELSYVFSTIPSNKFGLIYLAMHGNPERINMGSNSEFTVSLDELATMMGYRFEGFGFHFGSCAVMNSWEESLSSFKEKTGVAFVSGFSKYIDFSSSAIVDHILISEWAYSRSYKRMFHRMYSTHKTLLKQNGFEYII